MPKTASVVEIEVGNHQNRNLYFLPLQRRLRGAFDIHRVAEPTSGLHVNAWPDPIPGQRLGVDIEIGECYIAEPLHDPDQAANRRRIKSAGFEIGEPRESTQGDVPTWLYWLKRAVQAGVARVVKGELPAKIEGEPRTSFFSRSTPSPMTTLTKAMERQAAALERLAETSELQTKALTALLERINRKD